jgi:diguanylate cyclase (GGDEF)-like protein
MGSLKNTVHKNWRKVIIFSILIFAIILAQDIVREIVFFNNEIANLEYSLDTQMRDELRDEVSFRNYELSEISDTINDRFEEDLGKEIISVRISSETVLPFLETATDQEIEDELISIVDDPRIQKDLYKYTIITTDGTVVYSQQELYTEGESLIDYQDFASRYYIQDLIEIISEDENLHGGVVSYFEDNQFLYHGFRLVGTDYIIFIESSLADYLEVRLQEFASTLHTFYQQKDRSVFILKSDGTLYLQTNEDIIGTNALESDDLILKQAIMTIIDFAEENASGFVDIEFYDNFIDGVVNPKVTYITVNEETGLIVGFSDDPSSYQDLIVEYQNENMRSVLSTLIPVYITVILIVVYVTRLILFNNKLSEAVLNEEEQLYRVFSDITEDIILITDKKGNIIFTNKLGHKTIFPTDEFSNLNVDDILVDEEAFKVLIGIEKNHYIKSSLSQIVYDGAECDLYILKDVTEKVTNERKLEAMTLADELTGLGNRRLMLRDYKDYVLPHIKNGDLAFLAMIDLDNFKEANDKYGHTFGDDVLINISEIFKEFTSNDVRIYRVGGDEFALMAMNTTMNDCLKLLRKIKNKVSTFNYGKKVRIGFSAGLTEVNVSDSKRRLSDYYERADELLYKAKDEGKDRIKV